MTTNTFTAWHNGGNDDLAKGILDAHLEIISKVVAGIIKLYQFFKKIKDKTTVAKANVASLFLYRTTQYAAKNIVCSVKNLAECGVCDGLTVHFAMSAVEKYKFKSFLYDTWERADSKVNCNAYQSSKVRRCTTPHPNAINNFSPHSA